MKSNYKRLGDYIRQVKIKNKDLRAKELLGINIDKFFMPSVANVVGTDLSRYKIVEKNQFACNRMHVGRDYRIPIALSKQKEPFMVSPAYDVFEIIDTSELNPEYLIMWFSRKEFDRNAWFYTDADVRGGLSWKAFCDMQLPIPSIKKQNEIVAEYNTVVNRIKLNEQLNQKLEETAQAIYKETVIHSSKSIGEPIINFVESANTGLDAIKRAPIVNLDTGIKCLRIQDVSRDKGYDAWGFTKVEKKKFSNFQLRRDDIIIARTGATVGAHMFIKKDLNSVYNNGLIRVRANRLKVYPDILYAFFNTKKFMEHVESIAFGTSTQPNVKIADLLSINNSFPTIEQQNEIVRSFIVLNDLIALNKNQIGILEKLKDLFLSKMSKIEIEKQLKYERRIKID